MSSTGGAVAVTGASGLIGRYLRPALRDRPVTLLGRHRLEPGPNESWSHLDLGEPVDLSSLTPGSALCHLAYAMADGGQNMDYTHHAIEAVNRAHAVEHVVMMSSASVYGSRTTGMIDEETPLRPDSAYARTKAACDQAWLELLRPDCRLTVLRPTSVVAKDGPGIDALVRDAVHRPVRGSLKRFLQYRNTVHFVAVDDVVGAVRFVLDRSGSAREVFIIADDDAPENASYAVFQDFVWTLLGRRPPRTPRLPRFLEGPLGSVIGKPLGVRRAFSGARLAEAGFVPTTSLGGMLAQTVPERVTQPLRSIPR